MSIVDEQLLKARTMVRSGRAAEAEAWLRQCLKRSAREPLLNAELARVLAKMGKRDQASFFAAVAVASKDIGAVESAAGVFRALGDAEASIAALRRAVSLDPSRAYAHNALGMRLIELRRLDEAREAIERAYALTPEDPPVAANLAMVLSETWSLEEGLRVLRRARDRNPESAMLQHQMPFLANYSDQLAARQVFEEHRRFGELIAREVKPVDEPPLHVPGPADAERVLHVGFVSGDFREHSVARFLEAILDGHDASRVRYTLYPTSAGEDETTTRFRSMCEGWSAAAMLPEAEAVAAIRRDRVDVLIDLAGLTRGMKAGILIARAAPLQMTYLGYPNTTAMPGVDARIVDSITDPLGAESLATERLLRLDPCFVCFTPPRAARDIAARGPAGEGPVMFGSFNAIMKVTPSTLDLWTALLARVPGSRLLLKATALSLAGVRERVKGALAGRGIDLDRVEISPFLDDLREHYRLYHRVDIALDPFPYHGTTTTCEALYMGVPVVTMLGDRHAARVGASLLSAVGAMELVAANPEEYIRIGVELAGSPARRTEYHRTLRSRLCASALGEASAFARRFEDAIRREWRVLAMRGRA